MADATLTSPPDTASKDAATKAGQAGRDEASVSASVVTINASAADLYAYWRDFSRLGDFMENIDRIEVIDPTHSHWIVKSPTGTVEWDATVTQDEPGRVIGWESAEGAGLRNSGRVEFHDAGDRGTVVRAVIAYDPPGGAIGKLVAKLFQREPAIQARRDLRRFKQLIEAGEVATSSRTLAHDAAHKAG